MWAYKKTTKNKYFFKLCVQYNGIILHREDALKYTKLAANFGFKIIVYAVLMLSKLRSIFPFKVFSFFVLSIAYNLDIVTLYRTTLYKWVRHFDDARSVIHLPKRFIVEFILASL